MKLIYKKVAIIGLGLMGGSLALGLKKMKLAQKIYGWTKTPAHRRKALALGAADCVFASPEKAAEGADLAVIATPVMTIPELAVRVAPVTAQDCLITDMGSTKEYIVKKTEARLEGKRVFCGGHPLCGSEKKSIAIARSDLYRGAPYVLTPTISHPLISKFKHALEIMGARPIILTPQEHDRLLAMTSHLPHLLAFALCASVIQEKEKKLVKKVISTGFLDTTRIAASDPQLWLHIFLTNRSFLKKASQAFQREWRQALSLLSTDPEAFLNWLKQAQRKRESLNS